LVDWNNLLFPPEIAVVAVVAEADAVGVAAEVVAAADVAEAAADRLK
jgi:hypothetical protein